MQMIVANQYVNAIRSISSEAEVGSQRIKSAIAVVITAATTAIPSIFSSAPLRTTVRHYQRRGRPERGSGRVAEHPVRPASGRYPFPPRGPLAQLVEQGTLNPKVEGSNPSRPTSKRPAKPWFRPDPGRAEYPRRREPT